MDVIITGVKIIIKWHKVKLTGIPLTKYLHEKGMKLLKREIDL